MAVTKEQMSFRKSLSIAVGTATITFAAICHANNPFQLFPLAKTGDAAPGTTANFTRVVTTSQSPDDVILVQGRLTGPGVTVDNMDGIWIGRPGGLTLLAREGTPAPGTDADFLLIAGGSLNGKDEAFLSGLVQGTGVSEWNDRVFYRGRPGSLQLVVREGDPAVGMPAGVTYAAITQYGVDRATRASMYGQVRGPGVDNTNDMALWLGTEDDLHLAVRTGMSVPGYSSITIARLSAGGRSSQSGSVALWTKLAGPTVDESNDSAVCTYDDVNGLRVVLREGDAPPGGPTNSRLFEQFGARQNMHGKLAIDTLWTDPATGTSSSGIFLGWPDDLQLVVDNTTGINSGGSSNVTFKSTIGQVGLNDGDVLTFCATLDGLGVGTTNDTARVVGQADSLRIVAREGDGVPDAPNGIFFDDLSSAQGYNGINSSGQVAFRARLKGVGVSQLNDEAFFATAPNGELHMIIREGAFTTLEGIGDVFVDYLEYTYGQGGPDGGEGITDSGIVQITFMSNDTWYTAIAQVPEPSVTAALIVVSGLAIGRHPRRQ